MHHNVCCSGARSVVDIMSPPVHRLWDLVGASAAAADTGGQPYRAAALGAPVPFRTPLGLSSGSCAAGDEESSCEQESQYDEETPLVAAMPAPVDLMCLYCLKLQLDISRSSSCESIGGRDVRLRPANGGLD